MSRTGERRGPALHIDWTRCRARGHCTELLPELLEADDWGYPGSRVDGHPNDIPVPPALREVAQDSVSSCPVMALRLQHG